MNDPELFTNKQFLYSNYKHIRTNVLKSCRCRCRHECSQLCVKTPFQGRVHGRSRDGRASVAIQNVQQGDRRQCFPNYGTGPYLYFVASARIMHIDLIKMLGRQQMMLSSISLSLPLPFCRLYCPTDHSPVLNTLYDS